VYVIIVITERERDIGSVDSSDATRFRFHGLANVTRKAHKASIGAIEQQLERVVGGVLLPDDVPHA